MNVHTYTIETVIRLQEKKYPHYLLAGEFRKCDREQVYENSKIICLIGKNANE